MLNSDTLLFTHHILSVKLIWVLLVPLFISVLAPDNTKRNVII